MKEIPLTKGKFAIVDDEDYDCLVQWKWKSRKNYAYRSENYYKSDGKRTSKYIAMHRVIMGVTDRKIEVDHINGNPLDNRKENLRLCSHTENCWNTRRNKHSHQSKYVGIEKASDNTWCVRILVNGERFYIGNFATEEEAAYAYNEAAKEHHGEFAVLNNVTKPNVNYKWGCRNRYRGTFFRENRGSWFAYIDHKRKRYWLGTFSTEREAALAYNKAAIEMRGDKAKLNIID